MMLAHAGVIGQAGAGGSLTLPTTNLLAGWDMRPAYVTAIDGKVAAVTDISGAGFHALQSTAALRPTYTASVAALNDQPAATYSGARVLRLDGLVSPAVPRTYFFVGRFTDLDGARLFEQQHANALQCGYTGSNAYLFDGVSRMGVAYSTGVQVLTYQHAAGVFSSWRNGVAGTPVACSADREIYLAATALGLGARGSDGGGPIVGDLAAAFIYQAALDAAQRQAVWDYITQEWGV